MVSLWAARKASDQTTYDLKLSNRAALHGMLLEIDRELLHDPALAAFFDNGAEATLTKDQLARLRAYACMYFNLFEMAFAQFNDVERLTASEKEFSDAWDRLARDVLNRSQIARAYWPEIKHAYYTAFQSYVDAMLIEIGDGHAVSRK